MIPRDLKSYYRLHAKFYDITRWAFLFGRYKVADFLPELPNNARILDLGCGTGFHLTHLIEKYPLAEIIGLDLSPDMLVNVEELSVLLKNEEYKNSSFDADSFDLILCSYSLSMMSKLNEKIDAIMNHLTKTGMLLVVDFDSTPYSWFSEWMDKNHVNFDAKLFEKLSNRFDIEFTQSNSAYFGLYTYTIYYGKNW
jgi:S-adenosylmethionine-diacylgycerolhomoserine-N-methlytransferase